MGKRYEPLNRRDREVGIILLNFFRRRTKLSVLNDGVSENAGAAHDGKSGYLAGYAFNQLAAGPIDVAIQARLVTCLDTSRVWPSLFIVSFLQREGNRRGRAFWIPPLARKALVDDLPEVRSARQRAEQASAIGSKPGAHKQIRRFG